MLAAGVELFHALAMIVWGVGLPLLVWHRFRRLTRLYLWFSIVFVTTSVLSNLLLGECFLTTLARYLWEAGGGFRERVPFTVVFTNAVAGVRPSTRAAVLAWQIAIVSTSLGTLFCWRKTRDSDSARTKKRSDELGLALRLRRAILVRRGRASVS
jgi:hypothetical protein